MKFRNLSPEYTAAVTSQSPSEKRKVANQPLLTEGLLIISTFSLFQKLRYKWDIRLNSKNNYCKVWKKTTHSCSQNSTNKTRQAYAAQTEKKLLCSTVSMWHIISRSAYMTAVWLNLPQLPLEYLWIHTEQKKHTCWIILETMNALCWSKTLDRISRPDRTLSTSLFGETKREPQSHQKSQRLLIHLMSLV